jgi:Glycosyl hydrolases family 43
VRRDKSPRRIFLVRAVLLASAALPVGCSTAATPPDGGSDSGVLGDGLPGEASDALLEQEGGDDTSLDDAADAGVDRATVDAADAGGDEPDALADAGADVQIPPSYLNPVLAQDFPDPFILRQGSTYFAFATNGGASNIQTASSTDLAHWTVLGDALPNLPVWAVANAGLTWAPAILQTSPGSFTMYYTARDAASGFQCVSSAASSTPAGPYVDSSTSAFVCQVSGAQSLCGSIDPSPFVDADGTTYLVWKSDENAAACARPTRLWSAPLGADGRSLSGPPTQLLITDQSWQQGIIEGPAMTSVGGIYYLLYSANNYQSSAYAMGYATCLSPGGPCKNVSVDSPAISSGGSALGPGGGSFFDDALGAHWLVYHGWTAPSTTYAGGGARSLRVDRLVYTGGALSLAGPTTTRQPL